MPETVRLLEHYGSLGPGDTMTPEIDEVADVLVRRGVAEYAEACSSVPSLAVDEPGGVSMTRRQAKLQAHGRKA